MTGLLKRVREMTETVGLERGRPILVAVRIPASVACCEAAGLDVVRWLEEDYVDLLVPGEWELSPWEEMVTLGHSHDVPVYPCISWTGSKKRRGPPEVQDGLAHRNFRARAMTIWNSGADGVYSFNLPDGVDPDNALWRELGDPKVLARLDKDYFPHGYWRILLGNDFREIDRFAFGQVPPFPERPVTLAPSQPYIVTVAVGDDLSNASQPLGNVTLNLGVNGLVSADQLAVTLNDHPLSKGSVMGDWVSYAAVPEWVRSGDNFLQITNQDGSGNGLVLRDIHVRVANLSASINSPSKGR
jgi:hypothetical protein